MSRSGLRAFHNARLKKQEAKAHTGTLAQALKFKQAGLLANAKALCNEILSKSPGHFDALHLLGVTHYQHGSYEEADHLLKRAVAAQPRSAEAHSNRAAVLLALKRFDQALASCEEALAVKPSYPEALTNRGIALLELGRFDDAVANFDKALAISPDYADALSNRGYALTELRRLDEAVASCARAAAVNPRHAAAFSNLGNALLALERFDDALASYDKALAIKPDFPAAWLGRGNVCFHLKQFDAARAALEKAIAIRPDYFKAMGQLALCHEIEGNAAAAIAAYDRALAIRPDYVDGISQRIFALDFAGNAGFAEHQEARRQWWRQAGAKIAAASRFTHDNALDPDRPLVVGYVSSDFRQHSAALSFKPVLHNHDKGRFRIVCYSCSVKRDSLTQEFRTIADVWRDAAQFSDDRLAQQVNADRVDILVDLSGHSAGNRLGVFARKPAPIQVTAWGHATGTGLPTIDYLFSDPVSTPESIRPLFAEKIWDLPCCITVEAPPAELLPFAPPVVVNGHLTFGFFNRMTKISDQVLAVWGEIMRRQPSSRLLIKHLELEDERVRARLIERFGRHGVAADRLDFLGTTSREEHLAAYRNVDVCLDSFPQNGGISTWESLQMGVPVVAKLGDSASARVAGAILIAVGLDEWVANTDKQYAEIALTQAASPDRLQELRHALPGQVSASSAGNAEKYTRAVEQAYRAIWTDYCRRNSRQ